MKEGWDYLFYGTKRFGLVDGLHRWWKYHGSPFLWPKMVQQKYDRWKRIDRRKKSSWSYGVYAVNRDGDYYLVECPSCHDYQGLGFDKVDRIFECSSCNIQYRVYLEDGLAEIRDHRKGNIPLPAKMVRDDNGKWHLGITDDAPWWWDRREVVQDYREGKDGHGHKEYKILGPIPRQVSPGEVEADTPQRLTAP